MMHLYLSIIPTKDLRYVVYGVMALTISYWGGTIVPSFLLCSPVIYEWDRTTLSGTCVNVAAFSLIAAVINLVLNIIVIALPMPVLWKLRMPIWRKIVVTVIFGMGAV